MLESGRRRIGLVIEGGGAKGAYAFGWLRAFAKHGVRFDAIAGTSAGALNALIYSTGKVEDRKCRDLWRHMSFATIYPFRFPVPFYLVAALVNSLVYRVRWVCDHAGSKTLLIDAPLRFNLLYLLAIIVALTIVCGVTGEWLLLSGVLWLVVKILGACVLCGACIYCVLVILPSILDRMGLTLLHPAPLKSTLHEFLSDATFQCPTYIAVASEQYLFGKDAVPNLTMPNGPPVGYYASRAYVPHYLLANELTADGRVSAALASAALPFGVVPSVSVFTTGRRCIDGGVVDNCPIFPLVTHMLCDTIVVLRVNPTPSNANEDVQKRYQDDWCRIARIAGLTTLETFQICRGGPRTLIPAPAWPKFIEVGVERTPLGGPLAFLYFCRRFALSAEKRGWRDANKMSKEWWCALRTGDLSAVTQNERT